MTTQSNIIDYTKQAGNIPYSKRRDFLCSQHETLLYEDLKCLFERMDSSDMVEITHGKDELGRDLVIKHDNAWGTTYSGVVVKRGDSSSKITGEMDGIIAVICEQTRAAVLNPCLLHEIYIGRVTISDVRVIFLGRPTEGATKRIESEVTSAVVKVYPIAWLIDNFTKYYPEVFFEGELAEFIKRQIASIEAKQEMLTPDISLSSSFINPWILEIDSPSDIKNTVIETLHRRKLPFTELEKVVNDKRKILLVGDPGSGKSTAMNKIALNIFYRCFEAITSEKTKDILEIPILLKASELTADNFDELVNKNLPVDTVRNKIRIKVLLIDGIDEVIGDSRKEILEKAERFSKDHSCGIVVSTRKIEALKEVIVPFNQYELMPFEHRQAVEFIKRIVKNQDLLAILQDGLNKQELKISLTPLSLVLLVQIATLEREIPASIAEIFERYVDIAMGQLDIKRGIKVVFDYVIKKSFLSELAWNEFFLKGRFSIPGDEFELFKNTYAERHPQIKQDLEHFMQDIDRTGILKIGEIIFFRHRSFLEYFCAQWLTETHAEIKDLDETLINNIYFDYTWTDIAFYYVGKQRKLTKRMVDALNNYDETSLDVKILKVLIGRLLQAGWFTDTNFKLTLLEIALRQLEPIRNDFEKSFESLNPKPPTIYSDFFIMALSEYSFASKTFSVEIISVCNKIAQQKDFDSLSKCLFLLWANRNKLPDTEIHKCIPVALSNLSELELSHKLAPREKFISLFILEQIEKEDPKLLRQIRKKLENVKRLYPGDMRRLLPPKPMAGKIKNK